MRCILSLALLVAIAGCGDSTGPGAKTLQLGRYSYSSQHVGWAGGGSQSFAGTLVITGATTDEVTGQWEVDGFAPTFELGFWNTDAYVIGADPETFGKINHRIRRTTGGYVCSGTRAGLIGGSLQNVIVLCTVQYLGP